MSESAGWTFLEIPRFSLERESHFLSDEEFRNFQIVLLSWPEAGDVMQGCGGLRKIRWADPRRGKGKRGGLRIIYLLVPQVRVVVLVKVYDKDRMDDLTPEEKKATSRFCAEYKKAILKERKRFSADA